MRAKKHILVILTIMKLRNLQEKYINKKIVQRSFEYLVSHRKHFFVRRKIMMM